jgi:hypothetical protein
MRWIFKVDKNPQYFFLRVEVKPEVTFLKILRHVKDPLKCVRFQVLTAASMMFRAVFIPDDGGSTHL